MYCIGITIEFSDLLTHWHTISYELLDKGMALKTYFLAPHPLTGTKNKPAALHLMQRSPYYWWWAYLKRNADYVACCKRGGTGKLASLYQDFGDVQSDDFRTWWGGKLQRGQLLFAEQHKDLKLTKLKSADDWDNDWTNNSDVAVVAVNLTIGRRKLQEYFAQMLEREHKGRRGRPSVGRAGVSTARYPLHRNFSQHNLRAMLETYDAWVANQQLPKKEQVPLWAIGDKLKTVPSAVSKKTDTKQTLSDKHNVMSVAVHRYVKQAKAIIANTAKGQFPNSVSTAIIR